METKPDDVFHYVSFVGYDFLFELIVQGTYSKIYFQRDMKYLPVEKLSKKLWEESNADGATKKDEWRPSAP